ncbi:hypothetical protein LOTGIDRAFT_53199, partial [Lottia gigantea]
LTVLICVIVTTYCLEVSSNHNVQTSQCPPKCSCGKQMIYQLESRVMTVNCSSVGYVDIPTQLPSNTMALILTNNMFRNLTHLGPFGNLQFLDLSHNVIQYIDNQWLFEYLPNLHILRLSNNAIRNLRHGSFSGLKNLQSLDLSHNVLIHIELHAFGGLNHLVRLYLDHNQITELNRSWFLSMSLLYEVYLSHNRINRLDANSFDMLSQLTHLDLSNNVIKFIDQRAFNGLINLKFLDLSNNMLASVTAGSFTLMSNLQTLNLNSNPMHRITSMDFSDLNVTEISLSYMPVLRIVDRKAFSELSQLHSLKIHDNPALLFVHSKAFNNIVRLQKLYLHNNGLRGISSDIQLSLLNLRELHLYHNPLHCDCNIYWIKKQLVNAEIKNITTIFTYSDKLVCDSPVTSVNVPLRQVPLTMLSPVCPPTSLPLFYDHYNLSVGQTLTLECQALGVPTPDLIWLLPDGSEFNSTTNNKRLVNQNNIISIHGVVQSDSGTYACKAANSLGFDISSTAVNVINKNLKIVPIKVTSDTITVAWIGKIPRLQLNNFQLIYHIIQSEDFIHKIHLHKSLHRYTLKDLSPLTTYEFCLTYFHQYIINCQNITTPQKTAVKLGITQITNSHIIVGISSFVSVILALLFLVYILKRFRTKKGYMDPDGSKQDNMSHIPLENISQP